MDLNYTIYYPLERPYSALYPTVKGEDGKVQQDDSAYEAGERGDKGMWEAVQHAMTEGTLEALRNTMTIAFHSHPQSSSRRGPGSHRPVVKDQDAAMLDAEEDGESQEGFFEEDGGVSLSAS